MGSGISNVMARLGRWVADPPFAIDTASSSGVDIDGERLRANELPPRARLRFANTQIEWPAVSADSKAT